MQLKSTNSAKVINNTDPLHYLTEQQKLFVQSIVKGDTPILAARKAGYATPEIQGYGVLRSPKIQAAIKFSYYKYAKAAQMDRKRVMDGFLEAIEMAKMQADAGNMVAGWREIGRMCGYYAPEIKKIELSVTTRRVVDQLEVLSDTELLDLVEKGARTIEGTAENVLEHIQNASDDANRTQFGP